MKREKKTGGVLTGTWTLEERLFSTGEGWRPAPDNFIRLIECEFAEDGTVAERFADGDGHSWECRTRYFYTDDQYLYIDRSLYGINDLNIMRSQLMQIVRATGGELLLHTTCEQWGVRQVRLLALRFRRKRTTEN